MNGNIKIKSSKRFRNYLNEIIFNTKVIDWLPGKAIAEVVKSQRISQDGNRKFEEKTLQLGEAVLRLLASPESQSLKKKAKYSKGVPISKKWNAFLRFALWYSKKYELKETLQDFSELLEKASYDGYEVLSEIISAMSLGQGRSGTKFVRSFHDRKLGETSKEQQDIVSTRSLRAAFNSPFSPYVLASTSVGQEGLDFHRYCDSIVHWNPPSSPSVLRQREGRIDRFNSLQVRKAQVKVRELENLPKDKNGLSPNFVVMHNGHRVNQPRTDVYFLQLTGQEVAWKRCLERMHYDDLLIGAHDPLSDERLWLESIKFYNEEERQQRLELLKEMAISLAPVLDKKRKIKS